MYGSYRDTLQRSNRTRPDGRAVWPLTAADIPSRCSDAHRSLLGKCPACGTMCGRAS